MEGTFAAPGVHCEACYGAGSLHAFAPSTANITLLATPRETADFLAPDMAYGKAAACSDCHTRDGEKDYPTYVSGPGRISAKGGLIKHHEQYDEMVGVDPDDVAGGNTGPHRNLSCMACHDPHTTTKYMDISGDAPGMNKDCTVCHNAGGLGAKDYAITSGGMAGMDCTDCHMPKLAKSAVAHAAVGTGPVTGDIQSHIFRIDLAQTDQFTGDGAFAYPRITGDFACKTCHNGVDAFDMTFPSNIKIHDTAVTAEYMGTDTCLTCHGESAITGTDYRMFLRNGHSYKLNEIEGGVAPTYPFSTIAGALALLFDDDTDPLDPKAGTDNTLGTPLDYNDISFVIGGFGWKSRWIDSDGFIVTGSEVQYNLETTGMVAYHDNETDKKYDCGNCHTTGWKRYTSEAGDTRNLNRQNGLAGMEGTFAAPGVHCEACHGAGSLHTRFPSVANITLLATPRETADFLAPDMAYGKAAACSDCHTRDGEKDYPTYVSGPGRISAKGGLIKHHEQYDEMVGVDPDDVAGGNTGPHRNLSCMACHDPHTTTKYMDISGDAPGMNKDCTVCHNAGGLGAKDYAITSGGMAGMDCTDCHMPKLAKSAVAHAAVGTGPITGDIMSHIFRIDLAQTAQFTGDGAFAYPRITGDFACKTCHNSVDAFDLTFPVAITIHPAP